MISAVRTRTVISRVYQSPAVGEDVKLCEYLDQMPGWVEDETVNKGLVPSLHPLCLAVSPEVMVVEKNKKISESVISKRAPDIE